MDMSWTLHSCRNSVYSRMPQQGGLAPSSLFIAGGEVVFVFLLVLGANVKRFHSVLVVKSKEARWKSWDHAS